MAGRVISRANLAVVQEIYDRAKRLGAREPDAEASKAAGVFDLIEKVRKALDSVLTLADAQRSFYPHLEDIYPDEGVIIVEIGEDYYRAAYAEAADGTVTIEPRDAWQPVERVWQPVAGAEPIKAGALVAPPAEPPPLFAVKAVQNGAARELEIRVAWGWDQHKEQFHEQRTDFDTENFPTPPVAYYHGYKADGKPAPRPIYIGKTVRRENRADGHYLIAKLDPKPEHRDLADKVWAAALKSEAYASPGSVAHLIRKAPDGTLLYWPIAEISVWDGAPSRKQAHPNSLAFPVLKSLYAEAGLPLPAVLETDAPEAAGDAAAGEAGPVDAATAGRIIAAVVARALIETKDQL